MTDLQAFQTRLKDYLAAQLIKQPDTYTIVKVDAPRTTRKHKASPYHVHVVRMLVDGPRGLVWVELLYPVSLAEATNEHGEAPMIATARRYYDDFTKVSDPVYVAPNNFLVTWHALTDILGVSK